MGCLVSPYTVLPWGRGDAGKTTPLPLPTPMGINSFLFLKSGTGTSLGIWTSTEARSPTVTAHVRALQACQDLYPEGPEPVHGLLQLLQPVSKSTCALFDAPGSGE